MGIILRIKKIAKVLLITALPVFCIAGAARAYVEEVNDGSTKLTAGEINTNFNRMTNQGIISLKKLKQIDELMAKSPDAGDGSIRNVREVSQIVDENNDENLRQAAAQARETAKLLANREGLRNKTESSAVQTINEMVELNVRDNEVAMSLLAQLSRRKK